MKVFNLICQIITGVMVLDLMAGTAANSFATATGPGIKSVDDTTFAVVNARGPVHVTLEARPGWRFSEGKTKVIDDDFGGKIGIPVYGQDGEEQETLILSNEVEHVHASTNESHHISCGGLRATTDKHQLRLYPVPEKGVALFAYGNYEVTKEHVHEIVTEKFPCPAPGCLWGRGSDRITRTPVTFEPLPVTVRQPFEDSHRLYPAGHYPYLYRVVHTNSCPDCCCGASDDGAIDVYRAEMTTDPWIGLDRTDEGRKTNCVKVATVTVPGFDASIAYSWTPSEHCEEVAGGSTTSFSYQPKDHDTPSTCYRGELHACSVSISDGHGCGDSAQVTNRFTIVKVDVQIGEEVTEETEETVGSFLYEVPDRGGKWTEEGTNALVQVKITCEPSDGKMASEKIQIAVREGLLYEYTGTGAKRKFWKAKSSYTVRELKKTRFVLHGHSRSEKYRGDEIRVTHPTSGAVDVAKFTVFGRPWLVPDYDRLNGIDETDLAKAKEGREFYFWINDDDDWGDTCWAEEYTDDAAKSGNDYQESRVSGRRDLIDYTAVMIDVSDVFPAETPTELIQGVSWKLSSPCLKVVWSLASEKECRRFQTDDLPNCGPNLDEVAYRADVTDLTTKEGAEFPPRFGEKIEKDQRAVFFVEGCAAGKGLSLQGRLPNGSALTTGKLDIRVASVQEMYRWVSIRSDGSRAVPPEPKNWPDRICDDRNYVFVHGFNVNPNEARASGDDVFKRLWQSGLCSKVAIVTWDGDAGQWDPIIDWHGTISMRYHNNVRAAFMSARLLSSVCAQLPGRKIMLAHSLGNVLTSAAIKDWNLPYAKYFMIDAAVAIEAYDEKAKDEEAMVGAGWGNAPPQYRASRWWSLFPPEDFRHSLAWDGRFQGLERAVNCYSETEDVVGNYDPDSLFVNESAWYLQEKVKGCVWLHLTDITFGKRIRSEGGWGFNTYYLLNPYYCTHFSFWPTIKNVTPEKAKRHPLFTPFRAGSDQMYSLDRYTIDSREERDAIRAELLACAVPAESFAAGANAMGIAGIEDLHMMTLASHLDKWPSSRQKEVVNGTVTDRRTGRQKPTFRYFPIWCHSDFKQVAYFFNYRLFDYFIQNGK